jgi:DNA (cytosine-5)-methyltransferase 1
LEKGEGLKGRYMTKNEAASLQGMQRLKKYPETIPAAFKAFGNAVNVDLVKKIAEKLITHEPNRKSVNCTTTECI